MRASAVLSVFAVAVALSSIDGEPTVSGAVVRTINVVTFVAVTGERNYVNESSGVSSNGVAPMQSAVEDVNAMFGHLFNISLNLIVKRVHCLELISYLAPMASKYYYSRNRDSDMLAFVTCGCGEQDELNKLAAGWNVPFINSIARIKATTFRDKRLSPTYLSTAVVGKDDFASPIHNLLKMFNWTSIFVVIDTNPQSNYDGSGRYIVSNLMAQPGRQFNYGWVDSTKPAIDWDAVLSNFTRVSRVCLFFGSGPLFRDFMMTAINRNMANSDYVYITYTYYSYGFGKTIFEINVDQTIREDLQQFFRSVLILTVADGGATAISEEVWQKAAQWRQWALTEYGVTYTNLSDANIAPYLLCSYKAIAVLGTVLNETLTEEPKFDLKNGQQFIRKFLNRTISTKYGEVVFDEDGVRRSDVAIKDFNATTGEFLTVMINDGETNTLLQVQQIEWGAGNGANRPPANEPFCGYQGDKSSCQPQSMTVPAVASTLTAIAVITLVLILLIRKNQIQIRSEREWWDLDENLMQDNMTSRSGADIAALPEPSLLFTGTSIHKNSLNRRLFSGTEVWVTTLCESQHSKSVFRNDLLRLRTIPTAIAMLSKLRAVRQHRNVVMFYGLCAYTKTASILLVSEYCSRGSINDIIDYTVMDWEFKTFLMSDILAGMTFVHQSPVQIHGHLTGWRCLVDRYFTVKISDLGSERLKAALVGDESHIGGDFELSEKDLWKAPEVLRGHFISQAADVYSVAIVLSQIIETCFPFFLDRVSHETTADVLMQLVLGRSIRPSLSPENCPLVVSEAIMQCWHENPENRPSMVEAEAAINLAIGFQRRNKHLMAGLQRRLEKYALDLEDLVCARNQALMAERKKCEDLLSQLLPFEIVEKLRSGRVVEAQMYEAVTISFSGIVGFTALVARSSPLAVIDFLNHVYSLFDDALTSYDVYKVETISDSYMVASGVPSPNGDDHVSEICGLAHSLRRYFEHFSALEVELKTGIHTGACAAGVIGLLTPRYCLFGDSVNTAARMETSSAPSKIHLSSTSAELLSQFSGFETVERGLIAVKGKGYMTTFWLVAAPQASRTPH